MGLFKELMIYKPMVLELSQVNNYTDILKISNKYNFLEYDLIDNLKLYKNKNNNYIIVDTKKLEIKNYMFEISIYNFKGYNYMIQNLNYVNSNSTIFEYIEGIKIMMIYNNKWYLVQDFKIIDEKSPIYNFFFSELENDFETLDKNFIYNFMYLDSMNSKLVNYTDKYGKNYKKIMFLYSTFKNIRYFNFNSNNKSIVYPKKYNNISEINLEDNNFEFSTEPTTKGIILFINDSNNTILKLQNFKYQFYKAIGPEKHIFNGFIDLYQKDKLNNFMKNNNNHYRFNKIINPYNNDEVFDTIGCIDSLFKNISNELFNGFCKFYNIKDNKVIFHNHYKYYPVYYKKIFAIGKKNNFKNSYDFYKYLKKTNIKKFLELVKSRKLFNNWISSRKEDFSYLYFKNNKLRNKLAAVYVSKLFPEIIKTETSYRR